MIAAITCSPLSSINNGGVTYNPDSTSPFSFGTMATYSCHEGFGLKGENILICGGDGKSVDGHWNGSTPECAGVL